MNLRRSACWIYKGVLDTDDMIIECIELGKLLGLIKRKVIFRQ